MRVKRSKSLIARNVDSTLSGKKVKRWKSQIYKTLCMVEGWGVNKNKSRTELWTAWIDMLVYANPWWFQFNSIE